MLTVSKYDYHVHESHSRDAPKATLDAIIAKAEVKGIEEICFTSHLVLEGPDIGVGLQIDELSGYISQIEKAQSETGVTLRTGFEVDYFPSRERDIERLLNEYSVDFVLGSTHFINGVDIGSRIDSRKFFVNRPLKEAVEEYYATWTQAIESGLFDVMAHPDYWRKFLSHITPEPIEWCDYNEILFSAIQSLADNSVGFEVNTSALRSGLSSFYPVKEFLNYAKTLNVEKVTVGSDSHNPDTIGYKLPNAVNLIKKLGFKTVSTFKNRKNMKIPINEAIKPYTKRALGY